jgi:predicted HTH transcriptional regulator
MLETENTGRKRVRSPLSLFYQVRQISIAAQAMDEEKARAKRAIEKVIADREKMMGAIRSAQQEIILQEILSAVRENPMAGTCQIAKIIGRDRKTTHRKLDDLEKDGRVTKVVIKGLLKWKEAQP